MLKVLALACYPERAAATRYRLTQLVGPLAERGVELTIRSFLDDATFATLYDRSAWRSTTAGLLRAVARTAAVPWQARRADVLLIQREAMLVGPPVIELLARRLGRCPMILDLDDATYTSYSSPTYGRVATLLKWPGKTDTLIRRSALVTCGSQVVADYATAMGRPSTLVPSVVDTDRFRPRPPTGDEPDRPLVVGWVGTHSTFPFLSAIFPVLVELARHHQFTLRVVGSGVASLALPGLAVEHRPWTLAREVEDFQDLDIGLYPMDDNQWTAGKSGLKAIQYMAVGVPFVASPVGAAAHLGEPGTTHLTASTPQQWRDALGRLLDEPATRRSMGDAGRRHVVEHYQVAQVADRMAAAVKALAPGAPPATTSSTR